MKEYNVEVLFKNGYILNMPKKLVSNDFNSTKLNLSFDIEGRVLFKMLFPDKETFIVDEVKDNTIIFKEGYLSQEGIYLIEFAIYDENGRLTNNAISEIEVRRELVSTNEIVEADDRVPVLDGLIQDVNEAIKKVNNMENSGGTGTGNYTLPIASSKILGGIKVGANLTIEADGTLNAVASSSEGGVGENGATFTPNVNQDGILSWTNNKGLENPASVNIKGPQGEKGVSGKDGTNGADGYTPVKGIDYYTDADKQEMVRLVLVALPSAEGVEF